MNAVAQAAGAATRQQQEGTIFVQLAVAKQQIQATQRFVDEVMEMAQEMQEGAKLPEGVGTVVDQRV